MATAPRVLTNQQSAALSAHRVSVALSAGAGCGKTFVLTERFLRALEPDAEGQAPARLHELAAITFTDNAAREMRDRIRQACHQRLLLAESPRLAAYWRELLREMDAARISTIHSFCASLLRSHAVQAAIDPRFALLEEAQSQTLLYETIDDTLRRLLTDHDEPTLELLSHFPLPQIRDRITGLIDVCPADELRRWSQRTPDEIATQWEQFFEATYKPLLFRRLAGHRSVRQMLGALAQGGPTHEEMLRRAARLNVLLPGLADSSTPAADLDEALACAGVKGAGTAKTWESAEAYDCFKKAAEGFRKRAQAVLGSLQFSPDGARLTAEVGLHTQRLALAVLDDYQRRKVALAALDFNDLLQRAHRLLCDPAQPAVRQQVSSGIRLLLVDEFQDTDPVQVQLIEAICGDRLTSGRLFFVGDAKQSIYRFRGADPRVFRHLRGRIPDSGRLPLTENFRSQPAILHFVNVLFSDELGPEYEALAPRRPQATPTPSIEFMWVTDASANVPPADRNGADSGGDDNQSKDVVARRRCEARWIAQRLRQLFDDQAPLIGVRDAQNEQPACRPVRPGDVAILFRALSNVEYYEAALREAGLDYYLVGGHAFYSQQEVFDLLNLLRAVASQADDVSLIGALRSPFFSLADETLYWLAQHPEGIRGGLTAGQFPPALDATQRQRTSFAAATLAELRAEKDRLPIAGLIRRALDLTGYDALLLAEFMGERKLANLNKLIDQARTFDRSGSLELSDFLVQLAEFVARQPKEALAAAHAESGDVIRLMSIHQSKGLEFPLVVLPDLSRGQRPPGSGVGYAPELGPVVQLDSHRREKTGATGYEMQQEVEREEEESERLRLLYVATTRAADYLLLSAAGQDLEQMPGPWMELIGRRFDLRTGRCLAELPNTIQAPEIRVTLEEPPAGKSRPRRRRPSLEALADALESTPDAGWPRRIQPAPADATARRRFSFSLLTGQLEPRTAVEEPADEPSIATIGAPTDLTLDETVGAGAARSRQEAQLLGTLVHAVLERLDFASSGDWRARLAGLAKKHLRPVASQRREALISAAQDHVARLLDHPRGAALAVAQQRFAELDFVLAWPPEGIRRDSPTTAGVYLEGVIDCLYQDRAGAWHILDFKTNAVAAREVPTAAEPYRLQLGLYALALEKLLGQAPASLTLHFLAPGQEHCFDWNDKMRKTVIQHIGAAIDRLRQTL